MSPVRRRALLLLARSAFVLATVGFAWWGFEGRWSEIGDAIAGTGPAAIGAALGVTLLGLALTAVLWRQLLGRLGSSLPPRDGAAIFFLGQLGKYIPGSVWSFAAQAQLGRRHQVPARHTVAASTVFLIVHTFTGTALGAAAAATGVLDTSLPSWAWAPVTVGAAVALLPAVLRSVGSRIAGADMALGARDVAACCVVMLAVWIAYGATLMLLLGGAVDRGDWPQVVAAFALGHAAGVLLVLAPAGLGAREAVLIALLAPVVGTAPAAAAALLARLVHTVADFVAAAAAYLLARRGHVPAVTAATTDRPAIPRGAR